MSFDVPVAVFIFNRPGSVSKVLEAVKKANPPLLFVIADGPRANHPEDKHLVSQARAVVEQIEWPCEVLRAYSDVNLGCDRRIATGLDWVFGIADRAIVLEDDCLPDPTFFPYCEELLERYENDERVQMISGSNVTGISGSYSYHFSNCYHIWGWAGWARAWRHYDESMLEWPSLRDAGWLRSHLHSRRGAEMAQVFFDGAYAGRLPQWDFYWAFTGWRRNALSIIPRVNLVQNSGYGAGATHQVDGNHPFAGIPARAISFPLRHPPQVKVLRKADRAVWNTLYSRLPAVRRRSVRRRLVSVVRR
jgi:hypothetical protein